MTIGDIMGMGMQWPLLDGTYEITDIEDELRMGKVSRVYFDAQKDTSVTPSAQFVITGRKHGKLTGFLLSTPVTIDTTRGKHGYITFREATD